MSERDSKPLRFSALAGRLTRLGIAQKIGIVFIAFFLIATVNVVLVDRMMKESDSVADTVNVAGKLRMLGQRIAFQTVTLGHGIGAGEVEIRQLMGDFETALQALAEGGYVFGLYVSGLPPLHHARVQEVRDQWDIYRGTVQQLLEAASNGNADMMMGDISSHSTRLLERTEALMSGILMDVQGVQNSAMNRMYLLLLVDLLLILLAFIAVRRQIVVPLRDLSTHCRELAGGNYNTRFEVSTQDEIGQLAKVFNELAQRIGSLVKRVEQDRFDLERAERMFRGIAENSMVGVYMAHKGRFRYVNAKMAEMFAYTREDMLDKVSVAEVLSEEDSGPIDEASARQRLMGEVPGLWMEKKGRRSDGSSIDVELFGSLMVLGDDLVTIGIVLDVTHRKEVEAQAKLAMLVHRHSSEAMVVTDADGRLLSANPAFTKITGYQSQELIGERLNVLSSGRHDEAFYQSMWASIVQTGAWEGDVWNRRKNGEIYAQRLIINTSYDDAGEPRYRIGVLSDITRQKEADDFMWRQANYDYLTGLPNRQLFHQRLEREMQRSRTTGQSLALAYMDLDEFKEINNTFGHSVGDRVLVQLANRLQACVRSSDTVARLGGDAFALIFGALATPDVADRICDQVLARLAEPFEVAGETISVSVSMGITFYPADGVSAKELLQNADLAMYAANSLGKHRKQCFQPTMRKPQLKPQELNQGLIIAQKEGQFQLAYQPVVALASGQIEMVEGLIRWEHPEKGLVNPGVFLPFSEDTGLINSIGDWVFREATSQLVRWRNLYPRLQVAVNVSLIQFSGGVMSPRRWLEHLEGLGLNAADVVIEITERVLMDADEQVAAKLSVLREAGMKVALDDFGTGYSSISHLRRFDIDYLKLDESFVRQLTAGSEDLALCEAIIQMAHRFGLKVVAEGVETADQRSLLLAAGCDFAQGYLFSRPVGAEQFAELLRANQSAMSKTIDDNKSTGTLDQRT